MSKVVQVNMQNFAEEILNFKGIALVDFYADWCNPCKMLAPELEKLAQDLNTNKIVKIAKIDAEKNPKLTQEYGISGIPNVIIFKNGEVVNQILGLRMSADYKQIILDKLLEN